MKNINNIKFLKYAESNHKFFLKVIPTKKLNKTIIHKNKLRDRPKFKLVKIPVILLAHSKKSRILNFMKSIILSIYNMGITLNIQEKIPIMHLEILTKIK